MRRSPVPAVGVVCLRPGSGGPGSRGGEVLLIRRSKPPRAGEWSLPGGRVEWGETTERAALRELAEETGVEADLQGLLAVVDGLFPAPEAEGGGHHYVLIDYAARWRAGEPRAGDDAAEAAFVPLAQIGDLGLWTETVRVIRDAAQRFGA